MTRVLAETPVKLKIKKYLDAIPNLYHFPVINNGYGQGGAPDRVVCFKGLFIGFEVKKIGKDPTPRQETRAEEIKIAGGICIPVWSVDDVKAVIEPLR